MLATNKITLAGAGIALGLTILMSPAPSVRAATLNTGTTTNAPTWNRPLAGTPPIALSAVGTAVPYSVYGFTVSTAGNYTFQSTAIAPTAWDNFSFLYLKSFSAAAPLSNVIIGNDDNLTTGLSGFTTALDPGTNYYFVTTGFGNSNFGTFSNTITPVSGIGTASPIAASVPEPTTILGSLLAFGYGVYTKRKMQVDRSSDKETL